MKHDNDFKIVCIIQVYNELEKGNLRRFFTHLNPLVDNIVVYDDCSTDGSYEYALSKTPYVVRGQRNDFANESSNRQKILELALTLKPNFILWLDADEVLSISSKKRLQTLCKEMTNKGIDGYDFHEVNLWRSKTWQRLDSLFNDGWFTRLWKVSDNMSFDLKPGLHQKLIPNTIKKVHRTTAISVIHYGFSSDYNLAYKYITYKNHGQRGYVMLDRLINEDGLVLKKVNKNLFPKNLYKQNELPPKKRSFTRSLGVVELLREKITRPKYSIICLIYKDVNWLEFVYRQVIKYTNLKDCEFYFVANDASKEVKEYLVNNYIPHYIFDDKKRVKDEWYINNVYRAWNYGASKAKGDFLVFINSDMAFTPNWLNNLAGSYTGHNCVSSRLVESGKMPSGLYGISKYFGNSYSNYDESGFQQYSMNVLNMDVKSGGLFMPLLIKKAHFDKVGGYPEGNIIPGNNFFKVRIAKEGQKCISGDVVLIKKLLSIGIEHQTSFNSIVYHFQMGEMSSKNHVRTRSSPTIAICNDLVTGTMGEKVLWDYLLKQPGTIGIDTRLIGRNKFELKAKNYLRRKLKSVKIIIQNASYISRIDDSIYTVMVLQDNLRGMANPSSTQEYNLKFADKIITNSIQVIKDYPEYDMEYVPIGVDESIFKPKNKSLMRSKYELKYKRIGIFVGAFNKVKGFDEVSRIVESRKDIFWILITKFDEDFTVDNAKVYRKINHKTLSELLNCADFFILGSRIETQCLAAIEAALCNTPIIMHDVGIFQGIPQEKKDKLGYIGDDLELGINKIYDKSEFSPRSVILETGLGINGMLAKWQLIIEQGMISNARKSINDSLSSKLKSIVSRRAMEIRYQFFGDAKLDKAYFGRLIISISPKILYDFYRKIRYGIV